MINFLNYCKSVDENWYRKRWTREDLIGRWSGKGQMDALALTPVELFLLQQLPISRCLRSSVQLGLRYSTSRSLSCIYKKMISKRNYPQRLPFQLHKGYKKGTEMRAGWCQGTVAVTLVKLILFRMSGPAVNPHPLSP